MSALAWDEQLLDAEGHLADAERWNLAWAETCAATEGIVLGAEHVEIISFLREHWQDFGELPGMRLLLRGLRMRHGERLGSSRVLYRLFPEAPLRQACRIAGLPKPTSCI